MTQDITIYHSIEHIGQVANAYASQNVFAEYQQRRAKNTLLRQGHDLHCFSTYLADAGIALSGKDLMSNPQAWQGITFGLVEGYVRWQLVQGYAINSINVRLTTVKVYCRMATKAGALTTNEHMLIRMVQGFRQKEGRNIDATRATTRKGVKKATAVAITKAQAEYLKTGQPLTVQGKRDALLMCLLLDHGLRCGEIAALPVQSLNLADGLLTFYREKVDLVQTHSLTKDTLLAAMRYLEACTPLDRLLLGSRKNGTLYGKMGNRAITARVQALGKRLGIVGLSAHDCRHYWATSAIRGETDIKTLQDAGGWSSPAMPLRYAESSTIANKGVKLG